MNEHFTQGNWALKKVKAGEWSLLCHKEQGICSSAEGWPGFHSEVTEESKGFNWGCLVLCACLLSPWAVWHGWEGWGPFLWCSFPAQRASERLWGCYARWILCLLSFPSSEPMSQRMKKSWPASWNLLSPFSHCTSHFLVAEGVITGVGHPKFWLGCSVPLGSLLIYNFLIFKMRTVISTVLCCYEC